MKERNIPPYVMDDYVSISHPSTYRGFKNSLEGVKQYTMLGIQEIFSGEIGRYESVRFVEQTNIAKAAFVNGLSNWAYFFGNDTVAEGIVIPEEMRGKIPSDYGRDKGVAWYYLGGFGIAHPAADVQGQRIVVWDSAA